MSDISKQRGMLTNCCMFGLGSWIRLIRIPTCKNRNMHFNARLLMCFMRYKSDRHTLSVMLRAGNNNWTSQCCDRSDVSPDTSTVDRLRSDGRWSFAGNVYAGEGFLIHAYPSLHFSQSPQCNAHNDLVYIHTLHTRAEWCDVVTSAFRESLTQHTRAWAAPQTSS